MRKIIFVFVSFCIISFFILEAYASCYYVPISVYSSNNNIPNGADEIELIGKLDFNAGPHDIEAGATDDAVYIQFNRSFGNVNISIYNGAGLMVYSTVVNTAVQQTVIIPFTSVSSGTYSVVLNNANGYAEGDFERN